MLGSLFGGIIGGNQQQAGYNNASGVLQSGYGNAQNAVQTGYGNAGSALTNTFNLAQGQLSPYAGIGLTPLNNLINSGYLTHQFNNQDLNSNLAPNYAFQLQQGQGATNAASNAAGGATSGNAQKALQDYTQNYAGNAYQNAFNNYNAQRQNIFGDISTIAQMGQSGTNALANNTSAYGTNLANLFTGQGTAQSNLYTGLANGIAGNTVNAGNAQASSTQATGSTLGSILGTAFNGISNVLPF